MTCFSPTLVLKAGAPGAEGAQALRCLEAVASPLVRKEVAAAIIPLRRVGLKPLRPRVLVDVALARLRANIEGLSQADRQRLAANGELGLQALIREQVRLVADRVFAAPDLIESHYQHPDLKDRVKALWILGKELRWTKDRSNPTNALKERVNQIFHVRYRDYVLAAARRTAASFRTRLSPDEETTVLQDVFGNELWRRMEGGASPCDFDYKGRGSLAAKLWNIAMWSTRHEVLECRGRTEAAPQAEPVYVLRDELALLALDHERKARAEDVVLIRVLESTQDLLCGLRSAFNPARPFTPLSPDLLPVPLKTSAQELFYWRVVKALPGSVVATSLRPPRAVSTVANQLREHVMFPVIDQAQENLGDAFFDQVRATFRCPVPLEEWRLHSRAFTKNATWTQIKELLA